MQEQIDASVLQSASGPTGVRRAPCGADPGSTLSPSRGAPSAGTSPARRLAVGGPTVEPGVEPPAETPADRPLADPGASAFPCAARAGMPTHQGFTSITAGVQTLCGRLEYENSTNLFLDRFVELIHECRRQAVLQCRRGRLGAGAVWWRRIHCRRPGVEAP